MIPYTYRIGWSTTGVSYYGAQWGRTAHPDNLWVTYFTSSNKVHQYRLMYGEPDIIEIRKTFNHSTDARLFEQRVLRRLKKFCTWGSWLNTSIATGPDCTGLPKSDDHKRKLSVAKKGLMLGVPKPPGFGAKLSLAKTGSTRNDELMKRINTDPVKIAKTVAKNTGLVRTTESKRKMSDAKKRTLMERGGALNKGMKQYFNPQNHTQTEMCYPVDAPTGWVQGNPNKRGRKPYMNIDTGDIKWFMDGDAGPNWVMSNPRTRQRTKDDNVQC